MYHGDEFDVLEDGLRIPPKSLEHLGIVDGAQCWGVWVPDVPYYPWNKNSSQNNPPHLLLSPIPPHSWPCSFVLQIRLSNRRGTMGQAAKEISDANFNLLYTECTDSGFRHATWVAICEDLALRSLIDVKPGKLSRLDKLVRDPEFCSTLAIPGLTVDELKILDWLRSPDDSDGIHPESEISAAQAKERESKFAVLGILLLTRLAYLKRRLYAIDADRSWKDSHRSSRAIMLMNGKFSKKWIIARGLRESKGFLYSRIIDQEKLPWYLNKEQIRKVTELIKLIETEPDKFLQPTKNFLIDFCESGFPEYRTTHEKESTSRELIQELKQLLEKESDNDFKKVDEDVVDRIKVGPKATETFPVNQTLSEIHRQFPTGTYWPTVSILDLHKSHYFEPIKVRGLLNLSWFYLFGQIHDPLEFVYDAKVGFLKLVDRAGFSEKKNAFKPALTFPTKALASYDYNELFIRLQFLSSKSLRRDYLEIEVEYQVSRIPGKKIEIANPGKTIESVKARSSAGLLNRLCEVLTEHKANLYRMHQNTIMTSTTDDIDHEISEQGRVVFVVKLLDSSTDNLKKIRKSLNQCRFERAGWRIGVSDIRIKHFKSAKIFVSMHFDFDRAFDMLNILRRVVGERGFKLVVVDDAYAPSRHKGVTNAVSREIRMSDGFIQIVALRRKELEDLQSGKRPYFRNSWLHHEYGEAQGRGLNPIRLVDALIPQEIYDDEFRVDRDKTSVQFRSTSNDHELEQRIREAVRAVERHISLRRKRST